uniref:Uncharacterized protein n=1 Tax=Avena sativa TaxID=4498 RepID=A0ACD5TYW0_AVESA
MVDGRSKWTPYVVVVAIQSIYAGLFIFSKAAFNNGVNTYVFIFYRLAAATILLVPIALIDMACRTTPAAAPAMSWRLLFKLFLYALLGNTFTLNIYNMSLKHITASAASAVANCVPVITFLLALLMGMETMKLRTRSGMGKLSGIALCLTGVIVIALYAGPAVHPLIDHPVFSAHRKSKPHVSNGVWIRGTFLLLLSCITLCLWLVLQVPLLKEYPNKLVATTMQCFFGAIQSFVVAVVVERDFSKWRLGLDIGLLAVLYSVSPVVT